MFANFELYSGGWVDAEYKRKRRRSRKGCIPCRERHKKCDEARPMCGQCSTRRVTCRWRKAPSDDGLNSDAGNTPDSLSPSSISYTSLSSGVAESISSPSDSGGLHDLGSPDMVVSFPLHSLSPSTVFSECAKSLPSCSMVDLLQVFDRATSGHDFGGEYSLLTQGFPWLSRSPSMLHAWLSCSAMLISQFQTSWRAHALRQYTKAIRELRRSIEYGVTVADESTFATILILHVFGRFGDVNNDPSTPHLSAAARLHAAINQPPSNAHHALILEAFIYQIAINSTFRPSPLEGYEGLSRVIRLWSDSSVLQQSASSPQLKNAGLSAFLPIWTFDIIFKASHLLHNRHNITSDELLEKLRQLQTQLDKLQEELSPGNNHLEEHNSWSEGDVSRNEQLVPGSDEPASQGEVVISLNSDTRSPHDKHPDEGFHMRNLYFLAASLLILKLACPAATVHDSNVTTLFKSALFHLRHVRTDLPCLLWTITVLGIAASSSQDRSVIVAHVEAMRHFAGERAATSVLQFLAPTWGTGGAPSTLELEDEGSAGLGSGSPEAFGYSPACLDSALGLDVLFNESLMKTVIL
ncbi:hypothetical protein CEP51_005237 [Fusarium floridanum]|uniref:Zn(2)-C6 fungal-type domain-containing protein n=1 Tax=Fusarium floridanum TaxID=1325733 RepID=A0A428RXQ5_9HYPO|nr:hypothetical protein CEP51_005237 [Fusarium floridanum]